MVKKVICSFKMILPEYLQNINILKIIPIFESFQYYNASLFYKIKNKVYIRKQYRYRKH